MNWQAEYGYEGIPDADAARIWLRTVKRWESRSRKITSEAQYIQACRQVAGGERVGDARLLMQGWNAFTPTEWVEGGKFGEFLAYWQKVARKPGVVGSPYNPDPRHVFAAWREGLKFRCPDTYDRVYRIGKDGRSHRIVSRMKTLAIDRALTRASLQGGMKHMRGNSAAYSRRLLQALGRLSPEGQRVAIETIPAAIYSDEGLESPSGRRRHQARLGDVDWGRVARLRDALLADRSGRVRVALAMGRRAIDLASMAGKEPALSLGAWLCPAYPYISEEWARRLVLGETPMDLSEGILARKEAHEWLQICPGRSPMQFLERGLPPDCPPLRTMALVRWVLRIMKKGQWPQMCLQRRVWDQEEHRFVLESRLQKLDEIEDADLIRGPETPLSLAFSTAKERMDRQRREAAEAENRILAPTPSRVARALYPCMRVLNSSALLVQEHREQNICTDTYVQKVEQGDSLVVSIRVGDHRSTLELSRDFRELQHKGYQNGIPPEMCRRVAERFMRRLNRS